MRWLKCLAFAALICLAVSGCNTVKGFGRDVQRGGELIEKSADR